MAGILNNSGSMGINRNLGKAQNGLNKTLGRLTTGSRINNAFEDAAGLQISNNLRADIRVMNQGKRNALNGLGIAQVADQTLNQASGLLERAAEIAMQAASGTTSQSGREALDAEFKEIMGQLDSMGQNTKLDDKQIFGESVDVRTGESASESTTIDVGDLSAGDLGLGADDLLSEGNASAALASIQSAIENVSAERGSIGATTQRLTTQIQALDVRSESIQEAESRIRDADIADETVNLTKFKILAKAGIAAQAQSKLQAESVLSLLK